MSGLVLASQSASRQAMLAAAGAAFTVCPAEIDERAIEARLGNEGPAEVARALARAKALAVSAALPGRLVLGSDSVVEVAGRRFAKPVSRGDAAAHLRFFSGKLMQLHSAASIVRDGDELWHCTDMASLHVLPLTDRFIADYLDAEWPAVAACVGVFRIEARGVQLFDAIEGSHFTVLGMPLLPVLAALRDLGALPR